MSTAIDLIKVRQGHLAFKRLIYILLGLFFIWTPTVAKGAERESDLKDKVIVGFYEYSPYYYINEKFEPAGYYHDLMELISNELDIEYEYVYLSVNECLEKLKNEEIDLLFGLSLTPERQELYIFSKYYIGINTTAVFTNHPIEYGNLKALDGMTIGAIEHERNYQQFFEFLSREEVEVKTKIVDSYKGAKNLLMNNEVDAILYSPLDDELQNNYLAIYGFSSGSSYIATHRNNEELMAGINSFFGQFAFEKNNPINNLYSSYFNEYKKISELFISIIVILILGILTFSLKKILGYQEMTKKRRKILRDLEQNKYLLYYQPIIHPHLNIIVGFESLLRYDNGSKILSPVYFLKEIEETRMMYEVSIWILKQIAIDYEQIKGVNPDLNEDFYISLNVSFEELQDRRFMNDVNNIISSTNLHPRQLCFEIVERFRPEDTKKVQEIILELKQMGFKIAIDDFGIQYSNFDILDIVDYDVIKLDKYFIDEIETSFIKNEIVKCMSNIVKYKGKVMVIEGVESNLQVKMIKELYNDAMYIQGYYYSKPIALEDIKMLKIKSES